jgi:hypothetical protein
MCYIHIIYSSEISLSFQIISEYTNATFPSCRRGLLHSQPFRNICFQFLIIVESATSPLLLRPPKQMVCLEKHNATQRAHVQHKTFQSSVSGYCWTMTGPLSLKRRHYSPSNSRERFAHRRSITWEKRFESSTARGLFKNFPSKRLY